MCNSNIKKDLWMGQMLNKEAFLLTVTEEWLDRISEDSSSKCKAFRDLLTRKVFVHTKVNTTEVKTVKILESYRFNVVDTNITFDRDITKNTKRKIAAKIRPAEKKDIVAATRLAADNFRYTRFHLDPCIGPETAKKIKGEWVKNYFSGTRGEQLLVAEVDAKVIGLIQLFFPDDNSVVIDLIVVDKEYMRKGIATDLIHYTEDMYQDKDKIIVGTQIANIPSARLYEKLGFKLFKTRYVLHYHNN